MIWIDRLALGCAFFLWVGFLLITSSNGHPEGAVDFSILRALAILVGVPWLGLRILYMVFRGNSRRIPTYIQPPDKGWHY